MSDLVEKAKAFFEACETGTGWAGCAAHCLLDGTFECQAEPIGDLHTLKAYTNWMQVVIQAIPDGHYHVKFISEDPEQSAVCIYATFYGTHTGEGGPVPPTGKMVETDYVYILHFQNEKLGHMTKVWNAGWAMKALGWA